MKAYLSGAIEYAQDGGEAWREEITRWLKERLNHDVFNPALQTSTLTQEELTNFRQWKVVDYPRFKATVRKLIQRDLEAIAHEIDYVICYWEEGVLRGGGTHGELTMAYHLGKRVFTVLGMPRREVSSWILGCSTKEFENFEKLKAYLEQEYGS